MKDEAMGKFNGNSGRKPQTEARKWVYGVLAIILDSEDEQTGRFDPGDDADEFDRRRIRKAVEAVKKEMTRKAARAKKHP